MTNHPMFENADDYDAIGFKEKVYTIVKDIPIGYVLTYGTVALLAGRPRHSRMVGKFLKQAGKDLPAHRVVNHMGRTVPSWTGQRTLLEQEGVVFKENACVDLKKHLWKSM